MATPSSAVSDERFHEIDLPPVPEYESTEQAALDEALVTAMERAEAADETVLAHVLRCEVGSMRDKATLDVPRRRKHRRGETRSESRPSSVRGLSRSPH